MEDLEQIREKIGKETLALCYAFNYLTVLESALSDNELPNHAVQIVVTDVNKNLQNIYEAVDQLEISLGHWISKQRKDSHSPTE